MEPHGRRPAGGLTLSAAGELAGTPTASGPFTFTVTATDANACAGSAPLTLSILSEPNQAPSFTAGADPITLEDAGPQAIAWATAISPGPAVESGQVVTFIVTGNTNPALFSLAPAVSPTGTLTYTPAVNATGSATITVVLQDNGGTLGGGVDTSAPQSVTITLTPVNDAPSFTVGPNQTVAEDAGPQTVAGWATTISPGPADEAAQTVTFTVTANTNPAFFSAGPAVSPTGELTYTPALNAVGTATLTLVAQDSGGTASGGVDTSAAQTFTITITGVNDAPSFTIAIPNPTSAEDAGLQTVPNLATAISPGPADEAAQTVAFTATVTTNPALFGPGGAPAVSPAGTLTYTAAPNATGSATISLTLSDDGSPVATSAPQTFTITVTDTNDAPSFTAGGPQTVLEDAGAQTVAGWATAISPGSPDESAQTVSFSATADTPALFSAGPAISPTGDLTFTPAANATGTATITVTLSDNGTPVATSAPQTFTITITGVNDAPGFTVGASQTVAEDAAPQTRGGLGDGDQSGAGR